MEDLNSIQHRLGAALDRLEQKLGAVPVGAPTAAMGAANDHAAQAGAAQTAALAAEVERQKTAIVALERGIAELRAANAALIKANDTAQAGESRVADQSLQAEVAAMRADRQAEQAEVAALLVALGPLVSEEENADA